MKQKHSVSITENIWNLAKLSGINISQFLESKLIEHLNLTEHKNSDWKQLIEERVRHGTYIDTIPQQAINYIHHTTKTPKNILEKYCKTKNYEIE